MFTMPSIGLATFLYSMITATALLADVVRRLGFDEPISWLFHDTLACILLGIYCGCGLARIAGPYARYVLHRTLVIVIPVVLGIMLTSVTGWYICVEIGIFGTLVLHSYQMKVAHVRGYLSPGKWLY